MQPGQAAKVAAFMGFEGDQLKQVKASLIYLNLQTYEMDQYNARAVGFKANNCQEAVWNLDAEQIMFQSYRLKERSDLSFQSMYVWLLVYSFVD